MKIRWALLIVVATVVVAASEPRAVAAVAENSWDGATNFETKERFIPVELWAGVHWHGRRELEMPKVDANYRHNKSAYSIKGPSEWKHSATGEIHTVYERINPQSGGPKWQIFVINEERTGLGQQDHALRRFQRRARGSPSAQDLGGRLQCGQRIAQLVRCIGDEAPLPLE